MIIRIITIMIWIILIGLSISCIIMFGNMLWDLIKIIYFALGGTI